MDEAGRDRRIPAGPEFRLGNPSPRVTGSNRSDRITEPGLSAPRAGGLVATPLAVRLVAVLSALLLASGVTVIGTSLAHSAPAPRPVGGWAVPSNVGLGGWTETWSTGSLPDGNQPIALSSPTVADLDGQPSVVVGDRRALSTPTTSPPRQDRGTLPPRRRWPDGPPPT